MPGGQNEVHAIIGSKGTGKTTRVMVMAKQFGNVFFYDTLMEFHPSTPPGWPREKFQEVFPDFVRVFRFSDLSQWIDWRKKAGKLLGLKPPTFQIMMEPGDGVGALGLPVVREFLRERFRLTREPSTLIIEETGSFNRNGRCNEVIEEWATKGRHLMIDQIYVAQRAKGITLDVLQNCDYLHIFNQFIKEDLDDLRKIIPEEAVELVPRLQVGECVFYDRKNREWELQGHDDLLESKGKNDES